VVDGRQKDRTAGLLADLERQTPQLTVDTAQRGRAAAQIRGRSNTVSTAFRAAGIAVLDAMPGVQGDLLQRPVAHCETGRLVGGFVAQAVVNT